MRVSAMTTAKQITAYLLACTLVVATCPLEGSAYQTPQPAAQAPAGQSMEQLEQLTAPIALYPDALVAQILAGSTFPTQIVEADRWMQQNPNLKGDDLAKAVDKQSWDASVKALTQFPSVLDNMSKNLSWTSALGDAYFNQQQDVMNAVQELRRKAKDAGNLKTTPQQTVTTQGSGSTTTVIIQPANPQVVYVPTYSPAVVYGAPVPAYPGYSGWDVAAASMISFGVGMMVGAAISGGGCCGWGWNAWGTNWRGGTVVYNRNVYVSNSNVFVNRNSYYRNPNNYPRPTPYGANGNVNRGGNTNVNRSGNTVNRGGNMSGNTVNRGGNTVNINTGGNTTNAANRPTQMPANRGNVQNNQLPGQNRAQNEAARGYGQNRDPGTKSGAFSGYGAGGNTAAAQSRGQSSFTGGGRAAHGGGAARGGGRKR
jgi:Protein of unknown function (DUF3300)